jgi:hypothetical protein
LPDNVLQAVMYLGCSKTCSASHFYNISNHFSYNFLFENNLQFSILIMNMCFIVAFMKPNTCTILFHIKLFISILLHCTITLSIISNILDHSLSILVPLIAEVLNNYCSRKDYWSILESWAHFHSQLLWVPFSADLKKQEFQIWNEITIYFRTVTHLKYVENRLWFPSVHGKIFLLNTSYSCDIL